MSRWMEKDKDGVIHQGIISMYQCRFLIDDVCCNDKSDQCCDFPHEEYCRKCEHFVKEDGIIKNT